MEPKILPSWMDRASMIQRGLDLPYMEAKLDFIINSLGEKHLSWWEHKGSNQCRICDLFVICTQLIEEIHLNTSKSSLDSMNSSDYQYNCVLDQEPIDIVN